VARSAFVGHNPAFLIAYPLSGVVFDTVGSNRLHAVALAVNVAGELILLLFQKPADRKSVRTPSPNSPAMPGYLVCSQLKEGFVHSNYIPVHFFQPPYTISISALEHPGTEQEARNSSSGNSTRNV
jgi:hypothetical protein